MYVIQVWSNSPLPSAIYIQNLVAADQLPEELEKMKVRFSSAMWTVVFFEVGKAK